MECGSEASAHAEANASALQTGQRAAPLSHDVGEGLGVRAKKRCVPRTQRTQAMYPYQLLQVPPARLCTVPLAKRGEPYGGGNKGGNQPPRY